MTDALGISVVVFTDGADTRCAGPAACRTRREQTILGARQNQVRIFAIGLSSGADLATLGELASLSLATYRLRWTVRSDAPGGFRAGQALLGRVQVTTGGRSFDVPFVVGL